MSLIISIHKLNPLTCEIVEDIDFQTSSHNDLAGFEIWRKVFYGSDLLKKLGCKILPELETTNLFLCDDNILGLKKECELILENIEMISQKLEINRDSIEFRIKNIIYAADLCLSSKDMMISIS